MAMASMGSRIIGMEVAICTANVSKLPYERYMGEIV